MRKNLVFAILVGTGWLVFDYLFGKDTVVGFPISIQNSLGLLNDNLISLFIAFIIHTFFAFLIIFGLSRVMTYPHRHKRS